MYCKNVDVDVVLKVNFKGQKGQIWPIFHLEAIFSKTV